MDIDQNGFIIRHNPDSSYDSICMRCFRTVGTSYRQSELAAWERNHTCDEDLRNIENTVDPSPGHGPSCTTRKAGGHLFIPAEFPGSA